ncbi:PepSY-associated TM helix domain-containing protein [Parapedobacter sp. GCM10030251]|uniref:PepSY-associated TM helix domain-containing protein n=1 Tax=Parapedobacter sp. GCM10030251 TaxID=3273419 RepID=UPI0036162A18
MVKAGILWLHKWLAIVSGVVVFILGLTGCIYTFHDDLKQICYPEKYFISSTGSNKTLPLSKLTEVATRALTDGEKITRVDLYPAQDRSWIFRAQSVNEEAFGHWNYFNYYKRVFINPYTGEVVAIENSKTEFFQVMLQLHMNLLLGKKYGHPVVAYSTLIFILVMISGLVLWWPKKWKGKRQRRSFWPKWSVKWKRLNYDLHNIIGFYSFLLGIAIGLTGLFFSFPNWKSAVAKGLNQLNAKAQPSSEIAQPHISRQSVNPLDDALHYLLEENRGAGMMSIRLRNEDDRGFDVQVRLEEQRTGKFNWYYFEKSSLRIDKIDSHRNQAAGDRLASLNYDIHTGNIGGWPTKILAFIISLFCASLPITGYIIWINKGTKR